MGTATSDQRQRGGGQEVVRRPANTPIPLYNGVMSPDRWTLFGRMSTAFANTEFVPASLRGKPDAVMACLVFGDSLGLHPSTALKEVYVADGKVGISGALMAALIRSAGHKIIWEEITSGEPGLLGDGFVGWKCTGQRIKGRKVEDEDSWTYTMEDAKRAGLWPNANARASWMKSPKLMCRWRALSQIARFLFSDVFVGQSIYLPEEAEEIADTQRRTVNGAVQSEQQQTEDADYGTDPLLAGWLLALFASANELEEGVWLPKKIQMALKGKTQDEREVLATQVAQWIEERGGMVPPRPEEEAEDAEFEIIDTAEEGAASDDPGAHLDDDVEPVEVD